jgi:hypothetical protein
MYQATGPFKMSHKIKILLTKKELEIADGCSADHIHLHSAHRLNQYVKLVRKLRDKYRDLTRRQKVAQHNTQSFRTIEKSKAFDKMLLAFERQAKKVKPKVNPKTQRKIDQEPQSP